MVFALLEKFLTSNLNFHLALPSSECLIFSISSLILSSSLIAISLLPVTKATLRYGSDDGGFTVHTDIPELNTEFQRVAEFLNLEAHHVGDHPTPIHLCGDIEGHLGTVFQL